MYIICRDMTYNTSFLIRKNIELSNNKICSYAQLFKLFIVENMLHESTHQFQKTSKNVYVFFVAKTVLWNYQHIHYIY